MKHQQHIIAANIDQSVLVVTLKEPRTSEGFIDRFLVASEMYHVPAIIVINKIDLFRKKEEEQFEKWQLMYEKIDYKLTGISVKNNKGIVEVKELLKNKIS